MIVGAGAAGLHCAAIAGQRGLRVLLTLMVVLALLFLGALAVFAGLNVWQAILAVTLGNALAAVTHGWFSSWGPKHGVPQMVLGRTAFGLRGNILPAATSTLVAGIGWFAVNTTSGAFALTSLLAIAGINVPVAVASPERMMFPAFCEKVLTRPEIGALIVYQLNWTFRFSICALMPAHSAISGSTITGRTIIMILSRSV